ncbi:MAG TPA: type II toxin-antitoxin system death-on-curing family toxin [Terriglobales bacterium]|nr:type II toxin-antitoxin system death-on-curing family toxin [Terriglobales bacterium]
MKSPHWVDRTALLLLHAETLAEHGGLPGVRDEGALDAALTRPRQIHTYEPKAGLARLAAAYCFGLVRKHPFSDGNKRAGFLAMGLFLSLNGLDLSAGQAEAAEVVMRLAAGILSEKALTNWIETHTIRR